MACWPVASPILGALPLNPYFCGMAVANKDIETLDDVKVLVDRFYSLVKADSLLAPIFEERIQDRWPLHLEKMYGFWQTVLLEKQTYFGAPFPPHATLNIDNRHFEAWLNLFYHTVNELFTGDKAEEAKWRAGKMAILFQNKLNYYKSSTSQPLI